MFRSSLILLLVFLCIIPITVSAQNKQAGSPSKERVVLVTVEKVSEGMTSPTMMITGSCSRKCRQSIKSVCK